MLVNTAVGYRFPDLTGYSGTFADEQFNINGGTGDFRNISNSISGEFNVRVMDSGQELKSRGGCGILII